MEQEKNNFARAVEWLIRNGYAKDQKDLAVRIGSTQATICRNKYGNVRRTSAETIVKLCKVFGDVINAAYLRGDSDVMLVADLDADGSDEHGVNSDNSGMGVRRQTASPAPPDYAAQVIAVKDEMIAALRQQLHQQLADKDETIAALKRELEAKDALISNLQQQLAVAHIQTALEKGRSVGTSKHAPVEPEPQPRATR